MSLCSVVLSCVVVHVLSVLLVPFRVLLVETVFVVPGVVAVLGLVVDD